MNSLDNAGAGRFGDVATELVAYLIIVLPDLDSVAKLVPGLAKLVESDVTRILDSVVLARDSAGAVEVFEPETLESVAPLAEMQHDVGRLLTDRDIELASSAIRPGTVGVVLVTEDRWAEPLAAAAANLGGHIVAGERVPASRVEAALADSMRNHEEEG